MSKSEYAKAFEAATRELEAALQQRAELDQRIAHLRQSLVSLARLCGYTPTVSWGMSDGVRYALRAAKRPLSPVQVREELERWGLDMSKYANDLSAIHTTLKRLAAAGEVRAVRADGQQQYEWVGRGATVVAMTRAEIDRLIGSGTNSPAKKK